MGFNRGRQWSRLRLGMALWWALLGSASWCAGSENRITDIRFWQSPEEAQIVIDVLQGVRVGALEQLADGTWMFDVPGVRFRPGRQRYELNDALLSVITFQEQRDAGVRVFFKVPPDIRPRVFALPAAPPSKPDRVVIFLRESERQQLARELQWRADRDRFRAENVKVVVLDPGHGGEDPGTMHNGIIEKHLVLQVAKMVKAYFDRDPGYRAYLTRTGDYIIPLERRPQIAEGLGAIAFVSIHANYNRSSRFQGFEVYYESPRGAVGEAERLVAELENSQDMIGGVAAAPVRQGSRQEIIGQQAANMNLSRQLAERIEQRVAATPGLTSRGVRRAGFRVLHSLTVPSVLVELGYTNNPVDAALLRNKDARWRFAYLIYRGIKDFAEGQVQTGVDDSYLQYLEQLARQPKAKHRSPTRSAAGPAARTYRVRSGESLSKIAAAHGVTLADLVAANGLKRDSVLKVGQVLKIPASRSLSRRR